MSLRPLVFAVVLMVIAQSAAAADLYRGFDATQFGSDADAKAQFLPLANAGNPVAQYHLAKLLEKASDYAGALAWYRKAADAGLPRAQEELGGWYAQGFQVAKDQAAGQLWYSKAIASYQSLADQGDLWAAFKLGHLYYSGYLGDVKRVNALPIWRSCAKQGFPKCQYFLASALDSNHSEFTPGVGSPLDSKEAAYWWGQLLTSPDIDSSGYAAAFLGDLYAAGWGVPKDLGRAYALKSKAATTGDTYWGDQNLQKFLDSLPTLYVSASYTGFYKETSVDRTSSGGLKQGQRVYALSSQATVDGWREVVNGKYRGFVRDSDLSPNKPASPAAQRPAPANATASSSGNVLRYTDRCVNGDCVRTFQDGRQVRFQAKYCFDAATQQWEWKPDGC